MYDEIFQAERKVADFVRKNPELVVNANVSELANYSGVSDATVVRMCKHLGYEGYYQMKICLSGDLGGTGILLGRRNSSDTKTDYFRDIAEGILQTEAAVDETVFNESAELIKNSTMVHLVGVGNTSPVCLYCGFRLERIGIRCTYDALPEYYMNHISLAPPTDVVLAISWSGTTRNVVSALKLAREKGLKSVAVTAYQRSPVSASADYLLLSALENGENGRMSQYSRMNEMAVMEALIQAGFIRGVLDITTTEWCDELYGGVLGAGPHRLEAAAMRGIPQVVSVGALDMVNFGPYDTVPERYRDRLLYKHNPTVTLMRTTAAENVGLGKVLAEKLNLAKGDTVLMLPLKGVSAIDAEGQPFYGPEEDKALFDTLRQRLGSQVIRKELDCHINDTEFAVAAAKELIRLL